MALVRDAHCHSCGAAFSDTSTYPRVCAQCKAQVWANPIPVSVVLVPVRHQGRVGLLVVRRSIEPKKGLLALVGGFLEEHETWQQGGAREVREETDVVIDHTSLVPFWFTSTEPRPNRVLLFSTATEMDASALPVFTATNETSERGLVFGPEGLEAVFAFPLHIEAVRRFFAARGITGAHEFITV
ncbi:MAG: NUDIX domain-containing protein [Myxococcales bacterium]|nr:NUDIX domain-containing protein [Myxococcales bacterium]